MWNNIFLNTYNVTFYVKMFYVKMFCKESRMKWFLEQSLVKCHFIKKSFCKMFFKISFISLFWNTVNETFYVKWLFEISLRNVGYEMSSKNSLLWNFFCKMSVLRCLFMKCLFMKFQSWILIIGMSLERVVQTPTYNLISNSSSISVLNCLFLSFFLSFFLSSISVLNCLIFCYFNE